LGEVDLVIVIATPGRTGLGRDGGHRLGARTRTPLYANPHREAAGALRRSRGVAPPETDRRSNRKLSRKAVQLLAMC
jgi:hypothetical protein